MLAAQMRVALFAGLALVFVACAPSATPTPVQPASGGTPTPTRVAAAPTPTATLAPRSTATPSPKPAPTTAPGGPKVGGTIRHPQREDPPTWDPSLSHVDPLITTKTIVFTKLFTMWAENPAACQKEIFPLAVKGWRWVNDTTAEFVLKSGITYQKKPPANGREAEAKDAVAAFERFRNLPYTAGNAAQVDSVTATGKYSFQMRTKSPWGGLILELLANPYGPWLEPAEIARPDYDWSSRPRSAWVGSGPFMLESWTPGVKWRLVRNPDYWVQGRPYLAAVEYLVMPDASTQLAALRSGHLNFIRDFSEQLIDVAVQGAPRLQVARCPGALLGGAAAIYMDTSTPPFNDVRVRRAVSMAIDRKAIIDKLWNGRADYVPVVNSATQYGLNLDDFPPEVRPLVSYDPQRARQLLAEASYPNGFSTTVIFTPRYVAPHAMVAEAVAGMLNQVGIRAKLEMIEYARYLQTVVQAKYPAGQMAISGISLFSPEDGLSLRGFYSKAGSVNRSMVNSPEYDALYLRFVGATSESQRADLARQLQTMAAQQAWRVPLPMPHSTMTALPGIHFNWIGAGFRDYSMLLETAWME